MTKVQQTLLQNKRGAGHSWYLMAVLLCTGFYTPGFGSQTIHHRVLFLHSFFNNKHWTRTYDTITYELSSEFTNKIPDRVDMTGDSLENVAVFSANENEFYFMKVTLQPATKLNRAKLYTSEPVKSPVGYPHTDFELFTSKQGILDTFFFAQPIHSSNKIAVHCFEKNTFTLLRTDTLIFTLSTPQQIIMALYGTTASKTGSSCGLWAASSRGCVRYFSWNGTEWSNEIVYDIDPSETITAIGRNTIGTLSGKVYEFKNDSAFMYINQPSSTPIITINPAIGTANDGTIIKRKDNQWVGFTKGTANYFYVNPVATTNGSGVELLDSSWNYSAYTLENTPTDYTLIPDSLNKYINNNNPYRPTFDQTVAVSLIDPDGNYKLPQILLNNTIDMTDNGTAKLIDMHPDTACVPGFTELADSVLFIELKPYTVSISTVSRTAKKNPVTLQYYWSYSTFTVKKKWEKYNLLSIKQGSKTLYIENWFIGTDLQGPYNQPQELLVTKLPGLINITFSPGEIQSIRIYTSAGRQIFYTNLAQSENRCAIPFIKPSGMYYIDILFSNGCRHRKTFPHIN